MASSGLFTSRTAGTPACHTRTAYWTGSPIAQCCVHRTGPVAYSNGSKHQQPSSTEAAAYSNSCTPQALGSITATKAERSNNTAAGQHAQGAVGPPVTARNSTGRPCDKQSQRHNQRSSQQLSGAEIMRQLKAATNWQQLQQLVGQHGQHFNQRHTSALVTHLAQITAAHQQHMQDGDDALQQQQQQPEEQPEQQGLEFEPLIDLQQAAAIAAAAAHIPGSSYSNSSSSSKAIDPGLQELLRNVATLVDAHLQQYDARGLANVIWAVARLQPMLHPSASSYPSKRWLDSFCSISQPVLQQCDAQQLSNILWALVQLQHHPQNSWLEDWYAAFSQSCSLQASPVVNPNGSSSNSSSRPRLQLQALSSALWSVAQLHSSSSSCHQPPDGWVSGLLQQAAAQIQHGKRSSADSSGQALSNLLWSCVQLQQQPPQDLVFALLRYAQAAAAAATQDAKHARLMLSDQALSNLMWSLARLQALQQEAVHSSTAAYSTAAVEDPDEQRRRSSKEASTSDSSSYNTGSRSTKTGRRSTDNSSRGLPTLLCNSGAALLSLSTSRLQRMSWRHVATVTWAAGMLPLQASQEWVLQLQQRMQQQAATALQDQEMALLLWGVSQLRPTKQQQLSADSHRQRQQQPRSGRLQLDHTVLQQFLESQQAKLPSYSSLALHSSFLSLGRSAFSPSEHLLQAWLQEIARRNYLAGAGGQAMADVCCALAMLRRNQAAGNRQSHSSSSSGSSSLGSSWSLGYTVSSRLGFQQCVDADWLAGFCDVSASRLSACTGDQLSGIGWALAALGYKPPVTCVLTWQSAVADAASSMSAEAAARALWALKSLPSGPSGTSREAAGVQLLQAVAAAAVAGRCDLQSVAVAANSVADICRRRGSSNRQQGYSSRGSAASGMLVSIAGLTFQAAMQQFLQASVPVVQHCSSQQLLMVMSAAAAAQPMSPAGLLAAAVQRARVLAAQQQLSNRAIAGIMSAVARLQAAAVQQGHHHQQQQSSPAQQLSRAQVSQWTSRMLKAFAAETATSEELTMVLWSLAVLDYTPGPGWLNQHWLQNSQPLLPRFTPSQLASTGWALTVLNHRPADSWCKAWTHAAGLQAAAATPSQLALLLYCSVTLRCQVDRSWLLSATTLTANSIRKWSVRDLSLGLWGLAQSGLRAVADGELLEVLFSHLTAAATAAGMQELSPQQLLQLLQAVVLLRPPAAVGSAVAARLGADEFWPQGKPPKQFSKTAIRRLRWKARQTARAADVAAAAAVAAAKHHQQLATLQGLNSSSGEVSAAAVAAQQAAVVWSAAVADAAAAGAALAVAGGRNPDAVGMPVEPAWVLAWCQAAAQQMHRWSPSTSAAALSSIAALGVQPPVAWQQQLLQRVLQKRKQMTSQDVSTISSSLSLLNSPLRQQWLVQVRATYTPAAGAYDQSADAAQAKPLDAQQQPVSNAERKQRWQHRWLEQKRLQKSQLTGYLDSYSTQQQRTSFKAKTSVQYPQQLTHQSLLRLRRQQRTVRLATWWRRQQQLLHQHRQQHLLHQQRQLAAASKVSPQAVNTSNRQKLAQYVSTPGQSRTYSSLASSSYSSLSSSPVGSFDNPPGSSSSNPGIAKPNAGSLAQVRKLGSSSSSGLQLAERPVLQRPQFQPANRDSSVPEGAVGSSASSSQLQSPGDDSMKPSSSAGSSSGEEALSAAGAGNSGNSDVAAFNGSQQPQIGSFNGTRSGSIGNGLTGPDADSSADSTAGFGSCEHVAQGDFGRVNAVDGSCGDASGSSVVAVPSNGSTVAVHVVGVPLSYSPHPGAQQQHLSWACQTS